MSAALVDPALTHMPGCRCAEWWADELDEGDAVPLFMADERQWTQKEHFPGLAESLIPACVLSLLRDAARKAGVPFQTAWKRHLNDVGLPYSDPETRTCEMVEVRILIEKVSDLIEETVQRMVDARQA